MPPEEFDFPEDIPPTPETNLGQAQGWDEDGDESLETSEPAPSAKEAGSGNEASSAETSKQAIKTDDARIYRRVPGTGSQLSWSDRLWAWVRRAIAVWQQGIRWLRSRLPEDLRERLSEPVLSGIVLGLLVLLIIIVKPTGQKPATAIAPPNSPPNSPPTAISTPAAEIPAAESPALEVSPEDSRIAEIQAQVAEITQAYASGLIQSVQADFQQGILWVNLGSDWYSLTASQQDQLAQDLRARAQSLSFARLKLLDTEATLLARDPLVGERMVILRRQPLQLPN